MIWEIPYFVPLNRIDRRANFVLIHTAFNAHVAALREPWLLTTRD